MYKLDYDHTLAENRELLARAIERWVYRTVADLRHYPRPEQYEPDTSRHHNCGICTLQSRHSCSHCPLGRPMRSGDIECSHYSHWLYNHPADVGHVDTRLWYATLILQDILRAAGQALPKVEFSKRTSPAKQTLGLHPYHDLEDDTVRTAFADSLLKWGNRLAMAIRWDPKTGRHLNQYTQSRDELLAIPEACGFCFLSHSTCEDCALMTESTTVFDGHERQVVWCTYYGEYNLGRSDDNQDYVIRACLYTVRDITLEITRQVRHALNSKESAKAS